MAFLRLLIKCLNQLPKLIAALFLMSLSSCLWLEEPEPKETKRVRFAFDVVKKIDLRVQDMQDENTFESSSFDLGPEARLLLNLSHLNDHEISENNGVWAQFFVEGEERREQAMAHLQICNMNRSWMLISNWFRAHPYGKNGLWQNYGGDFDEETCISPTETLPEGVEIEPRNNIFNVSFDVTSWFADYVDARSSNHGLILVADEKIKIFGNKSPHSYPRIYWFETLLSGLNFKSLS